MYNELHVPFFNLVQTSGHEFQGPKTDPASSEKRALTTRPKNTSPNQAGRVVGELYIYNKLLVKIFEFLVALGGVIRVANVFVSIFKLISCR